jgi:hypothetical protein
MPARNFFHRQALDSSTDEELDNGTRKKQNQGFVFEF